MMILILIVLVLIVLSNMCGVNSIDYDDIYDDIYDNIDDYEYPYNHVNRSNL